MQEIQFLEFMGGSNLTHAHSNYLVCMYSNIYVRLTHSYPTGVRLTHPQNDGSGLGFRFRVRVKVEHLWDSSFSWKLFLTTACCHKL